MPRRWWLLLALCSVGCSRQDADALSRIGTIVLDRVQQSTGGMREKFQVGIHEIGKSSVKERVQTRLAFDRALQGQAIEVLAKDADVELKGTLKTADQKRRAIELAETTEGVAKVADSLTVPETPSLP